MTTSNRQQDERPSYAEHQLLAHTERLSRFRTGRCALHIRLSRLRAAYRANHHIRIAVNTFESLVKQFEGQLFVLSNADIVFIGRNIEIAVVDDAVLRLRQLFSDDPLTRGLAIGAEDEFCSWYDFDRQYDDFLAIVQALHDEAQRRRRRVSAIGGGPPPAPELQPLTPQRLGELVDAIARADLSNMMRRQAVCVIPPDAAPQPMFRELYISIEELRAAILPDCDIASGRWLFQHLTQTLDLRMLQLLLKNDDSAIASSYSVNLNVSTLLSERFLALDGSLRAAARGTIIIELQLIDILADLGAYLFARDFAKERGYRICVDGVTPLSLPFADRDRLGFDLVKILWQADMLTAGVPRRDELRRLVSDIGRARTILCRCDSEEAVAMGQSLGVTLFQGRQVDRFLAAAPAAGPATRRPPATARATRKG